MLLHSFHLGTAQAPSEAKADIMTGEGTLAGGGVVGVDALTAATDGVEEVVDVEEKRQSTVEEVGAHSTVDAEIGVDLGQQGLCTATVVGIGKDLYLVPQLGPEVEPQGVAKHLALGPLPGTILHTIVVVEEVGVEADIAFVIGIVALTAIAEIIRRCYKYDTLKGVRWSFVPFALSFFPYTLHWWTDTEGSLAAAVEEMPAGYDELMKPVIDNVPMLIVVIVLAIPVAILAIRLAEKALKKQAASLK